MKNKNKNLYCKSLIKKVKYKRTVNKMLIQYKKN